MARNPFAITEIGVFVPDVRLDNAQRAERFDYSAEALKAKIGIVSTSRKEAEQETSDMCVAAFDDLVRKLDNEIDIETLDLIVVVTQHPDGYGLPHSSAIVHSKLGLPTTCFAFDISLGCSGFVSALATVSGHLMVSGGKRAIIFTADPYSKSIDENDKNTAMIFGDAATATLIEMGTDWAIGAFDFGTKGEKSSAIRRNESGALEMNGRAVFDFCALSVPKSIKRTLERNGMTGEDIDAYALHPGSKFIVDTICKRAGLVAPDSLSCTEYGNTVSSSVPLLLAGLDREKNRNILISGFGVGLGWATTVLTSKDFT